MKVKRFFAQSMAEALKQVSEHMGPDAVILSSRKVDGGVEVVTALDYDENMARQQLGEKAGPPPAEPGWRNCRRNSTGIWRMS